MHIFALETDLRKIEETFLSPGEGHLVTVFYHWFVFMLYVLKAVLITIALIAAGSLVSFIGFGWAEASLVIILIWLIVVPYPLIKRYIDWKYDFMFVTTDKVIIIDQSSIFRKRVTQINMENFASVTAETQYANIFSFGRLHFHLKEGVGKEFRLKYVPNASVTADIIADAITAFQRRGQGLPAELHTAPTPPLTTAKEMERG